MKFTAVRFCWAVKYQAVRFLDRIRRGFDVIITGNGVVCVCLSPVPHADKDSVIKPTVNSIFLIVHIKISTKIQSRYSGSVNSYAPDFKQCVFIGSFCSQMHGFNSEILDFILTTVA